MPYTWAQKKEAMRELIDEYYAPPLREAGFVSYKDEGFHWYRIKGELLQTVRMPIFTPSTPLELETGFGAVPLFTWEHIAPSGAACDFDWDFQHGCDHFAAVRENSTCFFAQKRIGTLPRRSYEDPRWYYHLDNGLLIGHLNSECCGGEVVGELMLPVLDTILTVEDVYEWNRRIKAELLQCLSDEEMIQKLEKEYLAKGNVIWCMSLAFADECICCRDERFYSYLLYHLKQLPAGLDELPRRRMTKAEKEERMANIAHTQVLIKVLETGDRELFDAELAKQKERMLAQIRKKLPQLNLTGVK